MVAVRADRDAMGTVQAFNAPDTVSLKFDKR